jgi:hypothetical protein
MADESLLSDDQNQNDDTESKPEDKPDDLPADKPEVKTTSEPGQPQPIQYQIKVNLLPLTIVLAIIGLGFLALFSLKWFHSEYPLYKIENKFSAIHNWGGEVKIYWRVLRTNEVEIHEDKPHVLYIANADVFNLSADKPLSVTNLTLVLTTPFYYDYLKHRDEPRISSKYSMFSNTGASHFNIFEESKSLTWSQSRLSNRDSRIPYGESKETIFQFWVPLGIAREVQGITSKMAYSFEK